jgi:haloalkane dehalogenase
VRSSREAIEAHLAAGRRFEADGVQSFVRDQGSGSPVVLVHGVPTSSFLYRKVIPRLAEQGLWAVAFDFPGLGLAERPTDFDYSWTGLARWTGAALDALGIERCHLVVHDIGGPVACEWAVRNPDRVLSLTALNTMLDPATWRRYWLMRPFAVRGLASLWRLSMNRWLFSFDFFRQGVEDRSALTRNECFAHYELLRRGDGGRAFVRIMQGFELTEEKRRLLWDGLAERRYPAAIVWGMRDRVIDARQLAIAKQVLGVEDAVELPARHFLQEDQAEAVAEAIADVAAPLG